MRLQILFCCIWKQVALEGLQWPFDGDLPFRYPRHLQAGWNKRSFSSPVDHSKGREGGTFRQYCIQNNDHYRPERPLLFLEINGFYPLGAPSKDMVDSAMKIGAGMIVLEQRFSGKSLPTREFSVATLKKLSTVPQSVEDIALFGEAIKNSVMGIKIILFGCSSAGTIAALARKYYPHIFDGAIVSSAPLKLQLKNEKYAEVLRNDFSNPKVGGSDTCLGVLRDAHETIGERLRSADGRRYLESKFNLCEGDLESQQAQRLLTIYGSATGVALQNNNPLCETDYCNIEKICRRLTTGKDSPLDMLAAIHRANIPERSCSSEIIRERVTKFKDVNNSDSNKITWFGICSSRGLLASCQQPTCPFVTSDGDDWFNLLIWFCSEGFRISEKEVLEGVQELIEYVGDFRSTTNILSINGDADPWYPSSIFKEGEGPEVEMVQGASHCYWCNVDDKKVFERIRNVIQEWIR